MKRKLATTAALCLLIVALIALTAAPAASAKASKINITGTEAIAGSNPLPPVFTGGVAHLEAENLFYDSAPPYDALLGGWNRTHLYAVATVVDGVPTDSVMRGTFHKDCALGEWEGTFSGTMNMVDLTWDCTIVGKGVSGAVAGMLFFGRNVKTEPGPYAAGILTGTVLAPKGF